jgi:S-formylglutathione hydrolase FrmB
MFPRLSTLREDNYIAGLSNGGYGCLKLGLARPDLYGAFGAFSAGNKADVPFINDGSAGAKSRIALFGEGDMEGTENDLKYLGTKAFEKKIPLPKVYHACGDLDPWLYLNHNMRDFFTSFENDPYHYQYHEPEGYGHTWDFWDREIVHFFSYLGLEKKEGAFIGI